MKITSTNYTTGAERHFANVESAREWWEHHLAGDGCRATFEKVDKEQDGSYVLTVRRVWDLPTLNQGEHEQGSIYVDMEGLE